MPYRYHEDGTLAPKGAIWVFGSNRAGRHGAGAAHVAAKHYGAKYGQSEGFIGQSYAIPTKNTDLSVLSNEEIRIHVDQFIRDAAARPDLQFFVTRVGCGLAGFKDHQIAPLFAKAPENCNFADEWRAFLEPPLNFEPTL